MEVGEKDQQMSAQTMFDGHCKLRKEDPSEQNNKNTREKCEGSGKSGFSGVFDLTNWWPNMLEEEVFAMSE